MQNWFMERQYWSYDLYNTDTEEVEATENHTDSEVREMNRVLIAKGEPQRWVATRWVNH